ncbi:MAG: type II CRISPR RNA-guided endonuclease Cas9, partial [Rickettsiales bacterium]|nr:type II CRISPR RNA-guided endonuclease Cas9 [Rickettsiales bacterium]
MKYKLGLDLGVGSIGAAVINYDTGAIVDAGVRIFEVSEGAVERREKRTMRKNTRRTRMRMKMLAKILADNGLYPSDNPAGTRALRAVPVYMIRTDALDNKLESPYFIGRAILHLAKHRGAGYIDQAQTDDPVDLTDDGEPRKKKKSSPYELLEKYLSESRSRTVGEFLNSRYNAKRFVRQMRGDVDYAIPRYLARDEFNKIWDAQAQFYPQMTADLKERGRSIVFYETPSMPWAVGKCIYIGNEDRLPRAHPLSETRRIYEEVNNIRILTQASDKVPLPLESRDMIINELLMKGKSAGKKSIKELLELKTASVSLEEAIKPYLYSLPDFANLNISGEIIDFISNPLNPEDKDGRLYPNDEICRRAGEMLGVDNMDAVEKILARIPSGRGNLGITATTAILGLLKAEVISHREAADRLAENDKRFVAVEEQARKIQGTLGALPYYGEILRGDTQPIAEHIKLRDETLNEGEKLFGKIANPAVHMILNQLRRVVNEIVSLYGKPFEICVEVGRDVGMSDEQKKEIEKKQKENKGENDAARKYLQEHGLKISKNNMLKYRLAMQQGWVDAYGTAKIPHDMNGFEIEHLVPKTRGGTNAFSNLALVNQTDNGKKGNLFPYQYLSQAKSAEDLREIVKNARNELPGNKSWRFEKDAEEKYKGEGDEDESTRYLTDTRYVSKLAMRYLRSILNRPENEVGVIALRGSDTAALRHFWNLDGIEYELMNLNIPRYDEAAPKKWIEKDTGEIREQDKKPDADGQWKEYKTNNPDWKSKPRIDHRHHALDAIVAANCTRSMLQRMAADEAPDAAPEMRAAALTALQKVNVSHKADHNALGQLHEDSKYVMIEKHSNGKYLCYHKKKILELAEYSKLGALLIDTKINHPKANKDRILQQELFNHFYTLKDEAILKLDQMNEELVAEGKKPREATDRQIFSEAFRIIQERGLWSGNQFKLYENNKELIFIKKHNAYYKSGRNAELIFYRNDKEKLCWELTSVFDANGGNITYERKFIIGKVLWKLAKGDMLEMDTPEEWKTYTRDAIKCRCIVTGFS